MVFVPLIKLSGSSNIRKSFYFCIAISGYSAARLAHLVWDQRAVCSNHTTPTQEKASLCELQRRLCFLRCDRSLLQGAP